MSLAAAAAAQAQATGPPDSATRDALVAALTPVLAEELRAGRAGRWTPGQAWDVEAGPVAPAAARRLRDSVLTAVGGRPRTAADVQWRYAGVAVAFTRGDSALAVVDLGVRWCDAGGEVNGAGREYVYVFRRAAGAGGWAFARVSADVDNYDPAPPPAPDTTGGAAPGRPRAGRDPRCAA